MIEQLKTDFKKILETSSLSKDDIKTKEVFLNKFILNGFPTRRLENWKFSDLGQIIQKNIGELSFYNDYSIKNKIDSSTFINGFEHNKIIFINGKVEKIDFAHEDDNQIEINENRVSEIRFENENSLIDLNSALADKSYKISIKKNYSLKKPLVVYHTTKNLIKNKNINIRLEFQLEENSSLRLIDFSNDISEKNFINIIYNFHLGKNAILKNFKLDQSSNKNIKYNFNNIEQDSNSISETFILSAGSNFLKNEINCNLRGNYSSAFVNGVFSLMNNQHHEIRTIINHLTENTKSYQLIKSVLGKDSKSAYQGKIFVNSKAQKTDGYQLSKALLLDETSEFNAKPELEIYADDVKCSHGSTSGNIDNNALYYLKARGIKEKEAIKMIVKGFLESVCRDIKNKEITEILENHLDKHINYESRSN